MPEPKKYLLNGEWLTVREIAERHGFNKNTMRKRLQSMTPEDAVKLPLGLAWSEEELAYLAEVYNTPKLHKFWSKVVVRNGWRKRSPRNIANAIKKLQEQGVIGSRRERSEEDGWILFIDLARCLCVSHPTVRRWVEDYGMPAYRNGDMSKAHKKVHLKHFVDWAIGEGREHITNHLYSNRLGLQWFLVQVGLWINEKPPKPLSQSIPESRRKLGKKRGKYTKKTIDTQVAAKL